MSSIQRNIEIGQAINISITIASGIRNAYTQQGAQTDDTLRILQRKVLADAELLFPDVLRMLEGAKKQYGDG